MLFFFERIAKIGRDNFPVKTILNIFLLMVGEAFVYKGSDEKKNFKPPTKVAFESCSLIQIELVESVQ